MTELEELKQMAGSARRLSKHKDFKAVMEFMDVWAGINQHIFGILNAGQGTNYILAKEGSRAFSVKLRGLAEELEQEVNNYKEGEEEYE